MSFGSPHSRLPNSRKRQNLGKIVGQDGILRADAMGALRAALLSRNRPVDNRPQDVILPHFQRGDGFSRTPFPR